jgi:hypothetical protein
MKNKIFTFILLGMLLIGFSSFVNTEFYSVSHCCEKTQEGAWCQNAPAGECLDDFRSAPTSCESTAYCKLGCCYDGTSGNCMENTPQRVCDEAEGLWDGESASCEIPQCQLGCCLIGDQVAFVTQTRCKKMSSLYGLEVDYRTNIQNEMQCIASALSEEKGACVYEFEYEKNCKLASKRDCVNMGSTESEGTGATEFFPNRLCTDPTLGTVCAKTTKTTCVEGRDEVFFLDSCGNLANVYDSSKIDDSNYWSELYDVSEVCGAGSGNSDSASCGNCDYYQGSTCKEYSRTEDAVRPNYGEYICRDLACEYNGKRYEHGETWCGEVEGVSKIGVDEDVTNFGEENLPGSRYFRMLCYNGEVTVEPCADFRQEICLESEVNGFSAAGCVVNRWQDCAEQGNKKDCENTNKRDCQWNAEGAANKAKEDGDNEIINLEKDGVACFPKYPPGYDFWNVETQAEEMCAKASVACEVTYEKGITGGWKCVDGCECIEDSWEAARNQICQGLGDCGVKVNFIGQEGWTNGSAVTTREAEEDSDEGGGFLGF